MDINVLALELNSFYIVVGAVVFVCIIDILYILVLNPYLTFKKIVNNINKSALDNNKKIMVVKSRVDGANLKLIVDNNNEYYIKIINVKDGCDLQINAIDTFVMYTKQGAALKPKVLNDMDIFMKSKLPNRIIILSNQAKTIKKVINECEMIMVDNNTNVYNTRIINYRLIDEFIKNI